MPTEGFFTGIEYPYDVLFRGVALPTRVHQVFIEVSLRQRHPSGPNMINAKVIIPVREPALSAQAIDTAKVKLVPQPRFIRPIILVSLGTVTTHMRGIGIAKNHGHTHSRLCIVR
jgi:hypothetical protein